MEPKSSSLPIPKPPEVDLETRVVSLQKVELAEDFAEPPVPNDQSHDKGKPDVTAFKDLLLHSLAVGISRQPTRDMTQFNSELIRRYTESLTAASEMNEDTASILLSLFSAENIQESQMPPGLGTPPGSHSEGSSEEEFPVEEVGNRSESECFRCRQLRHSSYLYESDCERKCRVCLICIEADEARRCPGCMRPYSPAETSDLLKSIKYWKAQYE